MRNKLQSKTTVKTCIIFDADVWNKVRHTCIDLDIPAADFVRQAIEEKMSRVKK